MQVLFSKQFLKDIQKIKDKRLAGNIEEIILTVKVTPDISSVKNLKKLKGYHNAYRIKIGDYRMGLFVSKGAVEFVCFMNRKDIYKYFP